MTSPGDSRPDVAVVIVAAGAGVRAGPGEPKQFRPILGVPMLLRALRPFLSHPQVDHVVVTKMQADELPGLESTHRMNIERLVV